MIDVKLFNSDKKHLLNHRNINTVKEQVKDRLLIVFADKTTIVVNCTLEELQDKIFNYEKKLLLTTKEV